MVAGGADSSGYLNSAKLFAEGQWSTALRLPEELRSVARPNEFMPLGFTLGGRDGEAVPTYPRVYRCSSRWRAWSWVGIGGRWLWA